MKKIGKRELKKIMNIEVESAVKAFDKELGLYDYFWKLSPNERIKAKSPKDFEKLYVKRSNHWAEKDWAYDPNLGFHYKSRKDELPK